MTLVEVIVVIFVVALLFVLLSGLADPKQKTWRVNCVNNLKEIGSAFKIWTGDNGDKYPLEIDLTNNDSVMDGKAYIFWQSISNKLSTPRILHCTADIEHTAATNFSVGFSDANISYFFNLDGNESYPQMILTGDDNLTVNGTPVQSGTLNLSNYNSLAWTKERHHNAGNIGLADGSVQQLTSAGFNSALANSIFTNQPVIRLVIP